MPGLSDHKGEDWNALASDYAKISYQTSSAPITLMLERADALHPFSKATGILDDGCGPGPVMSRIINDYGSSVPTDCNLTCCDFSEGMINQAKSQKEQAGADSLWSKVDIKLQNAMDLNEIADESQSHVTAGMVFFMTPDPLKCLTECYRVLKPGGVVSCSAWEGSQWLDLMNLITRVRPDKQVPTMPDAWRSAKGIEGELKKAGFSDVEGHDVSVQMPFQDGKTFVEFLVTKLPHMIALTKDMSEDELEKLKGIMLDELKKIDSNEPGKLKGVSVLGVGRK